LISTFKKEKGREKNRREERGKETIYESAYEKMQMKSYLIFRENESDKRR
jgi:hypothetical protein